MTSTLKVVEHLLEERYYRRWGQFLPLLTVEPYDPHAHDGEWHAVVSVPHEVVEWEGYGVPVFEGDVERIEWERTHRRR